jgi:hypothetical protein
MAFLKYPNKKMVWKVLAMQAALGIMTGINQFSDRHNPYRSSFNTYFGYLLAIAIMFAIVGILIRNMDLITGKR